MKNLFSNAKSTFLNLVLASSRNKFKYLYLDEKWPNINLLALDSLAIIPACSAVEWNVFVAKFSCLLRKVDSWYNKSQFLICCIILRSKIVSEQNAYVMSGTKGSANSLFFYNFSIFSNSIFS